MAYVKIADSLGRLGAGNTFEDSVRDLNDGDLMTHFGADRRNLQSDITSTDHEDATRINQRLAEQLSVVDSPKSEYARQAQRNVFWESSRPRSGCHDQFRISKPATAGEL